MSQAQQFVENDMVFDGPPTTPAQNIIGGTILFRDGSYIIVDMQGVKVVADPGSYFFDEPGSAGG